MEAGSRWWAAVPLLVTTLAAGPAAAQEDPAEAYGTTSQSITTLPGVSFLPDASGGFYQDFGVGRASNGTGVLKTGLTLPTGVVVEKVSLLACDFSNTHSPTATILRCPMTFTGCLTVMATVSTGAPSDTPGCGRYQVTPTPFTIDNNANMYWIEVANTNGFNASLYAVQLHWRRQLSAAPASATFGDVPTGHPFFRFVEALAASGITGGCGNGQFCPDTPLTRGQMAVFLATALGLHFPN